MIHSIDLRFRQPLEDAGVERAGRAQIGAERLFDDDTAKAVVLFLGETDGAYLLDNRAEQLAGDGKVENCVAASLFNDAVQPRVSIGLCQIPSEMRDAVRDELPCLF